MISKNKVVLSSDDEEIKNTISHACDLYNKAEVTGKSFFTGFLTPLEAKLIAERFPKSDESILFFGGYDDAERVIAAFSQQYESPCFPLEAILIKTKSKETLSHRDYMGAILSLGIKRETVGDIVVESEDAIVFCTNTIAKYIFDNLFKVANTGVRLEHITDVSTLKINRQYDISQRTVSSLRADCVISAITGKSRSDANIIIERGLAAVNYSVLKSTSSPVKNGDIIAVRGEGKYLIKTDSSLTKKGRIKIEIYKYI